MKTMFTELNTNMVAYENHMLTFAYPETFVEDYDFLDKTGRLRT